MKATETLQDLIQEAKVRTVWWALFIFAVSYFLTHTSKSMWMNVPISILFVSGLRILLNEVEFHWKIRNARPQTYLSHLEKKQLSVNDSRLSTSSPPRRWKRKIDSPIVEAAIEEFVDKLLQDFVVDLWYSEITPDKEAPELIRSVIMDALGEVSGRVKEINLVDLLTRDVVDLIGDHLELFRRNQAIIGVDVMGTLSSEQRDERLKYHLMTSKELHPALISSDSEYKVLQRLMSAVLATILRPREGQSPLVRCIARELLTCLVMQPLMNFASPGYINELIEYIFLFLKDEGFKNEGIDHFPNIWSDFHDHVATDHHAEHGESFLKKDASSFDKEKVRIDNRRDPSFGVSESSYSETVHDDPTNQRSAVWARVLEAATQRRTEVLMPENLENMWTKGRNYKKKVQKNANSQHLTLVAKDSENEIIGHKSETSALVEDKAAMQLLSRSHRENQPSDDNIMVVHSSREMTKDTSFSACCLGERKENTSLVASGSPRRLRRLNSISNPEVQQNTQDICMSRSGEPISLEFYRGDFDAHKVHNVKNTSGTALSSEEFHTPKVKCRVIGAYFEKLGSKSFAVYSIAVTDAHKNSWLVNRRYSNFERLHRHLKDIPNYILQLPPKRIFSSSTEDTFVQQRSIQLDKYLQDLLSIANIAEQHEVWDFLSTSSKNYSFGKSSSVMKTLAVNMDDAMDDILRQFKGASDGLMRKVVGLSSPTSEAISSHSIKNLSWNLDETNKLVLRQNTVESGNSFSDNEEDDRDGSQGHDEIDYGAQASGSHSDDELNSKNFHPQVVKHEEGSQTLDPVEQYDSGLQSQSSNLVGNSMSSVPKTSDHLQDPIGVPPEWSPPNLSVPMLNLVDKIFQLKRRGWIRRQVFWISKQILQLMMEDAIDDWLLRQIQLIRREDTIAQAIHWVQDVLWPGGTFFTKSISQSEIDAYQLKQTSSPLSSRFARATRSGSFEQQLEAVRRASYVEKMIFDGAPTALVSLIGNKQYRRCARDLYYFLQSSICLKQLAYAILELLLVSIFPEMRDLVMDIHKNKHASST